jgi:REP element-mobilizing transposase RayT
LLIARMKIASYNLHVRLPSPEPWSSANTVYAEIGADPFMKSSGANGSRSEAVAESKDPYPPKFTGPPGAGCPTHSRPLRMSGIRHNLGATLVTAKPTVRHYADAVTQGLHRYYGTQDLHFITCSCYHRQPKLGTPERRDLFVEILEETRRKYRFVVHGYVVMPEHFHLLITEPELGDPGVVMKVVKERFARQINKDLSGAHEPVGAKTVL